jgi:hypothetical protein
MSVNTQADGLVKRWRKKGGLVACYNKNNWPRCILTSVVGYSRCPHVGRVDWTCEFGMIAPSDSFGTGMIRCFQDHGRATV